MTIRRFGSNLNLREDILDSVTPNVLVQKEVRAPAGEWKPAAWLPIAFTKTNQEAETDAFVISKGKAVAFDRQGRIVPAGMRLALGGTGTSLTLINSVCLTYTSTDVSWGVTDITTGERVTAAVTYTINDVADALLERGLVLDQEVSTVPPDTLARCQEVIDAWISRPIGFSHDDVYVWSGRPEDGDQFYTNYSKQHLISFWTEGQLKVPHATAGSTVDTFDAGALVTEAYAAGESVGPGEFWNATNVSQLARYSGILTAASPVVALGFSEQDVAPETERTPLSHDHLTIDILTRKRSGPDKITTAGDYYLDHEVGVLFLHSTTWASLAVDADTDVAVTFYNYDTGLATTQRYPHFMGDVVKPGDFVAVDERSNYIVASTAQISAGQEIVGRVLELQNEPRGLLASVKTAWNISGAAAAMKMPGSATLGYSDAITLSGETVADELVVFNFRV